MGAPTQIRVYDKKLFVWNDGGLPSTITLEELKYFHSSHLRDPILAEACFRGGYIDSWGSGIMKIMDTCRFAGLPAPEMKEKEGGFAVTLFKDRFTAEQLQQLGLNERQINAILFFKTKGEITTSEYMKKYDVAERTAREDLSEIVAKGLLLKKGETKSVKYVYAEYAE